MKSNVNMDIVDWGQPLTRNTHTYAQKEDEASIQRKKLLWKM